MCTQWRRTIAGGTILAQVSKEIINRLKKSMCKILLIKTKQNSYQRSFDFTNKVGSRTGRCCGRRARALPARSNSLRTCSWISGSSGTTRLLGTEGGGTSDPSGVTWRPRSPRTNAARMGDTVSYPGGERRHRPQEVSAWPPRLLWGQDTASPAPGPPSLGPS